MRAEDSGTSTEIGARALEFFQQHSLRKIARSFYLNHISRAQLASFAATVLEIAERGNETAEDYLRDGAAALATLATYAMERTGMQSANVAFIGGMMQSTTYRECIAQELRTVVPRAQMVPPQYDPAVGALVLAYKRSGVPVPERIA
jgi:N-acetylglucosamine kinase-like BadF-type ATPase